MVIKMNKVKLHGIKGNSTFEMPVTQDPAVLVNQAIILIKDRECDAIEIFTLYRTASGVLVP
jgi:hypothetical protein